MDNKIIGFILLFVGMAMIGWISWQSYGIFVQEQPAPEIFKDRKLPVSEKQEGLGGMIEGAIQDMMKSQMESFIPAGSPVKMMNLAAWSVFAMIIIMAGGKISAIGARLLAIDTFVGGGDSLK